MLWRADAAASSSAPQSAAPVGQLLGADEESIGAGERIGATSETEETTPPTQKQDETTAKDVEEISQLIVDKVSGEGDEDED